MPKLFLCISFLEGYILSKTIKEKSTTKLYTHSLSNPQTKRKQFQFKKNRRPPPYLAFNRETNIQSRE